MSEEHRMMSLVHLAEKFTIHDNGSGPRITGGTVNTVDGNDVEAIRWAVAEIERLRKMVDALAYYPRRDFILHCENRGMYGLTTPCPCQGCTDAQALLGEKFEWPPVEDKT